MNTLYLKGLTIIDLSHRLPGPLCGKILSDLGANVIKIEDHIFQDPFSSGLFAKFDSSFISWYENLNNGKTIEKYDFNSPDDQLVIRNKILNADAVIMGLPLKTREKLGITNTDLMLNKAMVVLELLSTELEQKSMHDLNVLAITGLLTQYVADHSEKILAPPFLPIAGITFGHKGATDLLAGYINSTKNQKTEFVKTYLDQTTEELLGIFWPKVDRLKKRTKFLHNGLYPCYCLYQTKDQNYVALAAVEEKFWLRFCKVFNLETKLERFHNQDKTLFELVSQKIQSYNLDEIEELIKNEDICLSSIKKI